MQSKRTPLTYYGGKTQIVDEVLKQFPPHDCYVEVFGGGMAALLHKPRSNKEVYNDKGLVAKFFKVLRDHGSELERRLLLSPYSYDEYRSCVDGWPSMLESGDMIEWARMWFVTISQSFTHIETGGTWRTGSTVNVAQAFANKVDILYSTAERLRSVIIENSDFDFVFDTYDGEEVLFYCDPPYMPTSRISNQRYTHEMSIEDHYRFLWSLRKLKGQAVVSGFDHEMYNDFLYDWRRVEIERKFSITNNSTSDHMRTKTEVLWIKEHHAGLWT